MSATSLPFKVEPLKVTKSSLSFNIKLFQILLESMRIIMYSGIA